MTLGQRLNKARKKLGVSAYRMAKNIGVTKATIHFWENDRCRPRAFYLHVVAKAYGLSMDDLEKYLLPKIAT